MARQSLFKPILATVSRPDSGYGHLAALAERYVRHEFNVLGSGWQQVRIGMDVEGFEGKNFADTTLTYEEARREIPSFYHTRHDELMALAGELVPRYAPIDWQIDIKSGFRYHAGVHHTAIRYGFVDGMDAKVSADLGRCYHLVQLGLAHRLTGIERYRTEAMAQMLDWIASNPCQYGAGWRACMNVAIRTANWLVALDLIRGAEDGRNDREDRFLAAALHSLGEHEAFIRANLEYPHSSIHPNHFISNISGLLMAAAVSRPISRTESDNYAFALEAIAQEIESQFYDEGANFEGATSYHCFVTEMLVYSLLFAARAADAATTGECRAWMERHIGRKGLERIQKMFTVAVHITKSSGLIPLIGDNDSARFLYLETILPDRRDWRSLLALGSTLFDDYSLAHPRTRHRHWFAANLFFDDFPVHTKSAGRKFYPTSRALENVGYYIMRRGQCFLLIVCGPVGTNGKGGHSHNAKLSVVLSLLDKDFFIDPGVFVYTASRYYYDLYRSTGSHNTLCFGHSEQNRRR